MTKAVRRYSFEKHGKCWSSLENGAILKRKGIGTQATRAAIIKALFDEKYIADKTAGKTHYIVPTKQGANIIQVLPSDLYSPQITAEWEEKLKLVERGELSSDEFMGGIVKMTNSLVKTYEMIKGADTLFPSDRESVGKCPRCGGAVTENKKSFCCSDKACGFAIWEENRFFASKRKELTKKIAATLLKDGRIKLNGLFSEKKGVLYDAIVILDDTGGKYVNFRLEFEKEMNMTHYEKRI